ncbi:MAG: F0F1 ATP synthase subunit delta [Candidatus Omnitrophota bacterium]
MSFLLKIFFLQIVAAAIVISILNVILDKTLIKSAIKQFEHFCQRFEKPSAPEIVVITGRPLAKAVSHHISHLVKKRFGDGVSVRYQIDKHLWGGIVIRWAGIVINYSLKDRVRQAFGKGTAS